MEFAYKLRARKPTQSSVDAAARLGFMLDIDDYWHEGVHGFMDQCEFCVPLCQRVRPRGREHWRGTGALRQRLRALRMHVTIFSHC